MVEKLAIKPHDVTPDGRAVARGADGAVVFAARALPGESLRVEPLDRSRGVIHARTLEVLQAAPGRTLPSCPAYARCDGCQWLHADEPTEYTLLESALASQLARLSRLTLPAPEPAIRLPRAASRDRLSLQLDESGTLYWLGPDVPRGQSRARHSPWLGADGGTGCPVAHPELNELGRELQETLRRVWSSALQHELRAARRLGHVPHVVLARSPGSARASLAWGNAPLARLLDPAMAAEPLWIAQQDPARANPVSWYGTTIHNDPRGFYQPSLAGAAALAETLRDWTADQRYGTLYDIYGGQGLWAWALADRCERACIVDASDYRPQASPVAWRWQRTDLSREQLSVREAYGGLPPMAQDLVVLDPPRAGLSPALITALCGSEARHLIYVSCGPDAMARDLQRLHAGGGWQSTRWRIVHQFPGSGHAELIAELRRPGPNLH